MVKFYHNNECYHVDFISSMGKDSADFSLVGKNCDRRIKTERKDAYAKHGIERKAIAAWEKNDTRKYRQFCQDRNYNYLDRYK